MRLMKDFQKQSKEIVGFLSLADTALKTMDEEVIQRLRTSTESFIIIHCGKESVFFKNYSTIDKWSSVVNLKQIRGLLLSLKDHMETSNVTNVSGELSWLLLDLFFQNVHYNLEAIQNLLKNDSNYFQFNKGQAIAIFNRFKERQIIAYTGNGQAYTITSEGRKMHKRLLDQRTLKPISPLASSAILKMSGYWDVFLCHSSIDKETVRKICGDLESRGVLCWFDEREIQPGDAILDKIAYGLLNSKHIVPFISHSQLKSGWARNEYQSVLARIIAETTSQKIIPVVLDDTSHENIPLFLSSYRYERYIEPGEYERFLSYLEKTKGSQNKY